MDFFNIHVPLQKFTPQAVVVFGSGVNVRDLNAVVYQKLLDQGADAVNVMSPFAHLGLGELFNCPAFIWVDIHESQVLQFGF